MHRLTRLVAFSCACCCTFANVTSIAAQDDLRQQVVNSLRQRRNTIHALKCELTSEIRICKGVYNEGAQMDARRKDLGDVPSADQTISIQREYLFDFVAGRCATNGYDYRTVLNVDGGAPNFELYREWSAAVFDGGDVFTLTPREKQDRRSIPHGIEFPVEYSHHKYQDDGHSVQFGTGNYPFFFLAGTIPDPRVGVTCRDLRPSTPLSAWRVEHAQHQGGSRVYLISPPTPAGRFVRFACDPALEYSIVLWEKSDSKHRQISIEIGYDKSTSPVLPTRWSVQTYDGGTLATQEDYAVIHLDLNPSIEPTAFVLEPREGMVVASHEGKRHTFSVSGEGLVAGDNYTLNHMIASRSQWWYVMVSTGIVAIFIAIGIVAYRLCAGARVYPFSRIGGL